MGTDKRAADSPQRSPQQALKRRLVTVTLRDLPDPAKQADEFGNRFLAQYQPENLGDLSDSIRLHGVFDPPVVARGKDGRWRIVSGHRRISALYVLARKGAAGFGLDLPVQCLELVDASELELLLQSIAVNELGKRLEPKERLLAVKKAGEAGATKKQIAATVGASEKAVERDLKIVKDARVLQHVLDDQRRRPPRRRWSRPRRPRAGWTSSWATSAPGPS
jgi:ParB-like chromosome segregation protein Spo0J